MSDELFERFDCDASQRSFEDLVAAYRPLVLAVCRRYLRDPADVDDATQETFLKLHRHAGKLSGSIVSWLSHAASSTCVDLIRRSQRETQRRENLGRQLNNAITPANRMIRQMIWAKLDEAMRIIDDRDRQLIVDRIFRRVPLRVVAQRESVALGTITRRLAAALKRLAAVLREMKVTPNTLDAATLAGHLGDWGDSDQLRIQSDEQNGISAAGLRFAPDWRRASLTPISASADPTIEDVPRFPGWSRAIRVGVLASHVSESTAVRRIRHKPEEQAHSTRLLLDPRFELFGIVEADTTHFGGVERTVREFELTAGLIDATDAQQLKLLDVIILGINFSVAAGAFAAIREAVEHGTGLLNEWWTNLKGPDTNADALMLAASPIHRFHMPPFCGQMAPATVMQEHPLFPGLHVGAKIMLPACGPVYAFTPGTTVIAMKDPIVSAEQHQIPGLGAARMPALATGQLGAGRVVLTGTQYHDSITRHLSIPSNDYFVRLLTWLAEPQRE